MVKSKDSCNITWLPKNKYPPCTWSMKCVLKHHSCEVQNMFIVSTQVTCELNSSPVYASILYVRRYVSMYASMFACMCEINYLCMFERWNKHVCAFPWQYLTFPSCTSLLKTFLKAIYFIITCRLLRGKIRQTQSNLKLKWMFHRKLYKSPSRTENISLFFPPVNTKNSNQYLQMEHLRQAI